MVQKKKIVDDLKKYNKELERHMPALNLDHLSESKAFSSGRDSMDDFMALFTNNLMDVRTEIELLRKNLLDNVQAMVLKLVNEQQNMFYKQVNEHVNYLSANIKNNFNAHIVRISDELEDVKKEFNSVVISNNNMVSKVDVLAEDVKKLDLVSDELELFKEKVSGLLGTGFGKVDTQMEAVARRLEDLSLAKASNNPVRVREVVVAEPSMKRVNVMSDEEVRQLEDRAISQVVADVSNSSQRLLSIDEKLKKLETLR